MSDVNVTVEAAPSGLSSKGEEAINDRLELGDQRMLAFEKALTDVKKDLAANTTLTKVGTGMVSDVHEVLMMAKSGIEAIGKFGRGLAWCGRWAMKIIAFAGRIATAIGAVMGLWYSYSHHLWDGFLASIGWGGHK